MKPLLWGLVVALSGAGCVSQTTISGTDQAVVQPRFDPGAAAKTRTSLALRYLQGGDTQQAKLNLDKAMQHAPRSPEVHRAFAYYYQQVNETALAEQAYRRSLSLAPENPDTLNNFGVFLCQQGQFQEAESLFLAALNQPDYVKVADTYENAGICAKVAGQTDRARHYLQATLNYNPRRHRALLEMAEIELGAGNVGDARGYLSRYQQIAQPTAKSLRLWEALELAAQHPQAAAEYRRERLLRFPDSGSTQND